LVTIARELMLPLWSLLAIFQAEASHRGREFRCHAESFSGPIDLGGNEVDFWRDGLDLGPSEFHRLQETFSPDELDRTARGSTSLRIGSVSIAARGILRDILARNLSSVENGTK
jgi:hypothetical protein